MPDENAYEATTVDVAALRSTARQTAEQTSAPLHAPITYLADNDDRHVEAIGAHWLLDAREHHIEDTAELAIETEHAHYFVVLLPDGALKTVSIAVEENRLGDRSRGRERITYERQHRVSDVGEEQIRLFDFEKSDYDESNTAAVGRRYWGNYHLGHGQALEAASKGDSFLRALDSVRRGASIAQEYRSPQYFYSPNVTPAPIESPQSLARQNRTAPSTVTSTHTAFTIARSRAVTAAAVWAFLCFAIWANSSSASASKGFAPGSYGVVTFTMIAMVAGGIAIDLTIGAGTTAAFMTGAVIGFAVNTYATFSHPNVGQHPLDISWFWLTALFGLVAYLLSALAAQNRST